MKMGRESLESTDFKRLIDALRDPDIYDHAVSNVETVETHISVVLLAGEFAYKIKKPVDFGFVDFTTLDKRKHFCEEELRLNRRFAPDLYLEVAAIRENGQAPSFKGAGAIVEYAVRMKRFDEQALLDRCIRDEGLVTASMVETFAGDVAAVHDRAATAGPRDGYGTPAVIEANVLECRDPIRRAGLIEDENGLVDELDRRAEALIPWFERRLRQGRVRECHGDLHLGNLFLDEGRIVAFDCIEFNPALRWIDVANEIAFFTMDLQYHGRTGFARRFRNAYLDATGDYTMLRVLRYYEVYRALVRAKIAGLREAARAGTGLRDARDHLDLASRMMSETPEPALIITCGLSGSGKTHLTTGLLAECEVIRIRSDVERGRCEAGNATRYSEAGIDQVYRRLLAQAQGIIGAGYPVIVDATFLKRARREPFRDLAARLDVPFRILHCTAPESELRWRVASRTEAGTDLSEADLAVLERQLGEFESFSESEAGLVVVHDAEAPIPFSRLLPALGASGADRREADSSSQNAQQVGPKGRYPR